MAASLVVGGAILLWCCGSWADGAQPRGLAAGKLLVAARELTDPNFAGTVIFLTQYDEDSAVGLIINQPTRVNLSRVFDEMELGKRAADPVYRGGPVELSAVLALVRSPSEPENAGRIFEDIYLTDGIAGLEDAIKNGTGQEDVRLYLGYSGWGPGQLDREVALGSWHILDGDPDLVFDPSPSSLWDRLIKRASMVIVDLLEDRRSEEPPPVRSGA